MPRILALMVLLLWTRLLAGQSAGSESLLIGPGDQLHVQFYDTPELDQHPRVDDAGRAPLLFLGPTELAGKTPDQAAELVVSLMVSRHFMSHPQVVVSIEQFATQGVIVSGEVQRPGSYAITTPRTLLDVLTLAGGLDSVADRHIVIRHRGSEAPTPYFVSNDPKVQLANEVMIRPGDSVLVPRAGLVYVFGDVLRPGGYPLASNDGSVTLLQAIANAGSPNKTAVISGIRLMRKEGDEYVRVPLHLHKVENGSEPDPVLLPDDVVIVPFSYVKNFLLNSTGIVASVGSAAVYR